MTQYTASSSRNAQLNQLDLVSNQCSYVLFIFISFDGVCQAGPDLQGGRFFAKHLCLRWNIDYCRNICSFEIVGCLENIYRFWNIRHSESTDCLKFLCKKLTQFRQHPLRGEICHCRHYQQRCKFFASSVNLSIKLHILWHLHSNFIHIFCVFLDFY